MPNRDYESIRSQEDGGDLNQARREHFALRDEYIRTHYFADHPDGALTEDIVSGHTSLERGFRIVKETGGQDAITKLLRAEILPLALEAEMYLSRTEHANERQTPLENRFTVVVVDIDDFKALNTDIGHDQANGVLEEVGFIIGQEVRKYDRSQVELLSSEVDQQSGKAAALPIDTVVRWGGEEFVAVFSMSSMEQARVAVERIRLAVKTKLTGIRKNGKPITVSCGMTEFDPRHAEQVEWNELVQLADKQMYQAKEAGKDGVYPLPVDHQAA